MTSTQLRLTKLRLNVYLFFTQIYSHLIQKEAKSKADEKADEKVILAKK